MDPSKKVYSSLSNDAGRSMVGIKRKVYEHPRYNWAYGTMYSHEYRGIRILFEVDQLIELAEHSEVCAICGGALDWFAKGKMNSKSPTLDVMKPVKYMDFENIQIVHLECNTTKGRRSMEEFVNYCEMIVKKFGRRS